MAPLPTHVSTSEAAQRLQAGGLDITAPMLRRWVAKKQIAGMKLPNGRTQVAVSAIEELLPKPAEAAASASS